MSTIADTEVYSSRQAPKIVHLDAYTKKTWLWPKQVSKFGENNISWSEKHLQYSTQAFI